MQDVRIRKVLYPVGEFTEVVVGRLGIETNSLVQRCGLGGECLISIANILRDRSGH